MKATAFIICCLLIGVATAAASVENHGVTLAFSMLTALWAIDELIAAIREAVSTIVDRGEA